MRILKFIGNIFFMLLAFFGSMMLIGLLFLMEIGEGKCPKPPK